MNYDKAQIVCKVVIKEGFRLRNLLTGEESWEQKKLLKGFL
jgi:hypothetical protein